MARRWDEIQASPDYQVLPEEQKKRVQERFWTNVVATSKEYQDLDTTQQARVRSRFFGPQVVIPGRGAFQDDAAYAKIEKDVAAEKARRAATPPRPSTDLYRKALTSFLQNDTAGAGKILANADPGDVEAQNLKRHIAAGATPPPTSFKPLPYTTTQPIIPSRQDLKDFVSQDLPLWWDNTKEIMVRRPEEGAKVLRDAAVDLVAPSEAQIEAKAARTGRVPYVSIAGRVIAPYVAGAVPLTPKEIALYAATGKALEWVGAGAGALEARLGPENLISKGIKLLRSPVRIPFRGAAQAAENEVTTAMLTGEPVAPAGPAPAGAPAGAPPPAPSRPVIAVPPEVAPAPGGMAPEVMRPPALPGGDLPERLANRPQMLKRMAARVEGVPPGEVRGPLPDKDYFGQQLRKFAVADDAKAVLDETSEAFKPYIDKARRGKIDWEGTKKLADDLGWSFEDVLRRNKGEAFNAEKLETTKALTGRSLEDVVAAQRAYAANPGQATLAQLAGEMARHARIQAEFMGARAEAGRALQILRKVTDPANLAKQNYQAMLDAIGGEDLAAEAAKRLSMIDPGDTASVNRFIREFTKAKTSDQLYEVWINSILSNPLTHKANMIGNKMSALMRLPEKVIRGSIDAAAGAVTGRRTAFVGEVPHEAYGMIEGITDGVRRAAYAFRNGITEVEASKLEVGRIPAIKGGMGEFIRTPTKLLTAEDEFAKAVNDRMELAARAYRIAAQEGKKGVELARRIAEIESNPSEELMKKINDETLYRTFQKPGGEGTRLLMKLRNAVPGLRYIIPFLQTPINVTKAAVERSPLGWFSVIHGLAKGAGQEAVVQDAARATMGSAIAAAVAYYSLAGRVTGAPPQDPAERDRFYRSGKMPYSMKIGDKWYSYARIEPLSMIMGATAQAVQLAKENGGEPNGRVVGAILASIPKYLVNQTFLAGVSDVLNAIEDPDRYGNRWIQRNAGSVVPYSGFTRFIAQQLDDVVRQPDTIKEAVMANIPGLSKRVPARYDAYGQPATRPNDLFSTIVVPRRQERASPFDAEDVQIGREQGFPGRTIGEVPLTQKEHREVVKISGRKLAEARAAAQRIPGWKLIPAPLKVKYVDQMQQEARDEGKRQVFKAVLKRLPNGEDRRRFIDYGFRALRIAPSLDGEERRK